MKLLIAESVEFSPTALARLQEHAHVLQADLDRAGLLEAVHDVDVLWVRLRNQIDAEVLDAAPHLKIIVTNTTGLNHVDCDEAQRRGIHVLSLRGEETFLRDIRATAELTLGLVLMLMRKLPGAVQHVLGGHWDRDQFKGRELYGKTAGVVGYGRLGRIVARYLTALDMHVIAADPYIDAAVAEQDGISLLPLEQLLAAADLVTVHANLTAANHEMIGQSELAAMKPGAWLVNTARGELIDERALLDTLHSGHLSGAALDVLANETAGDFDDHPLVQYACSHDNLILTPHLGGCTVESLEKTENFLADKLVSMMTTVTCAGGK